MLPFLARRTDRDAMVRDDAPGARDAASELCGNRYQRYASPVGRRNLLTARATGAMTATRTHRGHPPSHRPSAPSGRARRQARHRQRCRAARAARSIISAVTGRPGMPPAAARSVGSSATIRSAGRSRLALGAFGLITGGPPEWREREAARLERLAADSVVRPGVDLERHPGAAVTRLDDVTVRALPR